MGGAHSAPQDVLITSPLRNDDLSTCVLPSLLLCACACYPRAHTHNRNSATGAEKTTPKTPHQQGFGFFLSLTLQSLRTQGGLGHIMINSMTVTVIITQVFLSELLVLEMLGV